MEPVTHKKWQRAQRGELNWWKRYLKRKDPSDYLDWKLAYWKKVLSEAELGELNGLNVLDAGCGPAGIFMALPGCRVTAEDPLLEEYARHLSHFRPEAYPWVEFVNRAFEDFDTEQDFDLVFAMNAINHFRDLEKSVRKLCRLTMAGGRLVVSVDAHRFALPKYLLRWIPADRLHPHQYSAKEYSEMFISRGLPLVKHVVLKNGPVFRYVLMVFRKPA